MENSKAIILREANRTRAWIEKRLPVRFEDDPPDYDWNRALSDSECEKLLVDPYCMFSRPSFMMPNNNLTHRKRQGKEK